MGNGIFFRRFGICEDVVDIVDCKNSGEIPLPYGESLNLVPMWLSLKVVFSSGYNISDSDNIPRAGPAGKKGWSKLQ